MPPHAGARGTSARVDGVLQLRAGARRGDRVRAARAPRACGDAGADAARRAGGPDHAGPSRRSAQHIHVHKGVDRGHAYKGVRQSSCGNRAAFYCALVGTGAGQRLGGQLERPERHHRGSGQGHLPHDAGHRVAGGGPGAGRHRHQPDDCVRVADAFETGGRRRGIQLLHRPAESDHVAALRQDQLQIHAETSLQRSAVVPGRRHHQQPAEARRAVPAAAPRARRAHGPGGARGRQQAHDDPRPEQAGEGGRLSGVLHHPPMVVRRRQRAGAVRGAVAGGQADVRLQRAQHRLGRVHRVVRAGHTAVPVQGEPGHVTQVAGVDTEITHSPRGDPSSRRVLPLEISVLPLHRTTQHLALHSRAANKSRTLACYSLMPGAFIIIITTTAPPTI